MKKIICFLLALLPAALLHAGTVLCPQGGDDVIIIKEIPDPEDERGPAPVQAYLVSGDISISLASSLGIVSITVQNSLGQTVYNNTVDATLTSFVLFAAPTAPDIYSLIIQASSYYGIGQFAIQ